MISRFWPKMAQNEDLLDEFCERLSLESTSNHDYDSDQSSDEPKHRRRAAERHECIDGKVCYELESRQTVPEDVYAYDGVRQLSLDYNYITQIPDQLALKCTQLTVLSIMGNKLSSLPPNIDQLVHLEELFVDENQLNELPQELCLLSQLKRLHCQGNRLKTLPEQFHGLQRLQALRLNENQLSSLPELFGQLQELHELDLSYNCIDSLPQTFGSLRSLRVLNVCHNQLKALPHTFGQLSHLEILELSSNGIEFLSETLLSANRLRRLFLDNNCICSPLPDWFGDMEQLEELCLKSNTMRENPFPERFGDVCQKLTKFDISGNLIESLPESFANLKALVFVDTGSVNFEPERRKYLRNGNNIRQLPKTFGIDYRSLKELRLDENDIEVLPACFGAGMPALEVLDLYCNMIKALPESFCQLKSLRIFSIGMNCLQCLPKNFGDLTSLEELRVEINELRYLPPSFDQLVNLRVLDLYQNSFTAFPSILRELENIKQLHVGLEVTKSFVKIDTKEAYKLKRLQRAVDFGVAKRNKLTNFFTKYNLHSYEDMSPESLMSSQTESTSYTTLTSGYSSTNDELHTSTSDQSWDPEEFDPERPYRHEPLSYPSCQRIQTPVDHYSSFIPLYSLPKPIAKQHKRIKLVPVDGQFDSD